ncbi:MAG: WYL domain-containing protein [Salinivirgaceae bacterium]|nr:WYL domain-containing protein [Salinivirgaceae bacterium]MDY0282002.1 WYL domain-containing protein [Salinivirgaceae bacterium]
MEQPKIERLLRLIQLLIGNRRNTNELAQILGCAQRTVQRDIETLGNVGFVVEHRSRSIPFLTPQQGSLKEISDLIHFSKEEAYILHRAIDSIDDGTAMKQNLKGKLYNLYNYPWLADVVVNPELSNVVHNLMEAIDEEMSVVLKSYRSANSNVVSNRQVEPFQFTTNFEQVWCYCPTADQCKLFKTARIGSVEVLHQPWQHKAKHIDAQIDVFRISGQEYIGKAKLELNVRAYSLLIEEYPLAEQFVTPIGENSYLFEAPVCSYEGVCRFVLGLFPDIHILGDQGLKTCITEKIDKIKM